MKHLFFFTLISFCSILTIAQPTAGLVGYWKMDGNFNDAGPYAIHGSNFGSTATTNYAAVANKAMLFLNPSTNSTTVAQWGTIPVNSNVNFSGTQDFTIAFYTFINSPYVHTGGFYDNNLNYGGPGIWFWNSPGTPTVQFNYKNASVATLPGTLPLGQWVHICCLRASGTLKIYINGNLNNSGAEGPQVPVYTYPARLGTMFFASYPHYNGLNGKMDELRIYNRALTQAEITVMAVLPIKLSSFTAVKNNADILLQWQTAYEQNSSHFNVQRSTDGINFSNIRTVQASGNSSVTINYRYTDNTVKNLAGVTNVFYRLELVDIDASKALSSIVSVKLNTEQSGLMLLENPVRNDLRLQFTSQVKENINLIITDASGRQVLARQIPVNIGSISTVVPVNILAGGIYYITLVTSHDKQTLSFLKQ